MLGKEALDVDAVDWRAAVEAVVAAEQLESPRVSPAGTVETLHSGSRRPSCVRRDASLEAAESSRPMVTSSQPYIDCSRCGVHLPPMSDNSRGVSVIPTFNRRASLGRVIGSVLPGQLRSRLWSLSMALEDGSIEFLGDWRGPSPPRSRCSSSIAASTVRSRRASSERSAR